MPAAILGLGFLEYRPGHGVLRVVRSIGEIYPFDRVASERIQDLDVICGPAFRCWHMDRLSVWIYRQPIDTARNLSVPENLFFVDLQAVDHTGARSTVVCDVELAGDSAASHSSD